MKQPRKRTLEGTIWARVQAEKKAIEDALLQRWADSYRQAQMSTSEWDKQLGEIFKAEFQHALTAHDAVAYPPMDW